MFTSCCPGWVALVEKSNPELIPYLSTCKSPQMMLGAVIKNYFAQETGKAPTAITNVSIMPCVRKQGEADREWFNTTGRHSQLLGSIGSVPLGQQPCCLPLQGPAFSCTSILPSAVGPLAAHISRFAWQHGTARACPCACVLRLPCQLRLQASHMMWTM